MLCCAAAAAYIQAFIDRCGMFALFVFFVSFVDQSALFFAPAPFGACFANDFLISVNSFRRSATLRLTLPSG
jgi:hypothetical protein